MVSKNQNDSRRASDRDGKMKEGVIGKRDEDKGKR